MRILAIANQKGGAGKTTVAVNLAAALGEQGYRTLLLDLDPEHHATSWLGLDSQEGLLDVLQSGAGVEPLVRSTKVEGVDLVPGHGTLSEAAGAVRALEQTPALVSPPVEGRRMLQRAVRALPERWQFVVIDCQPTLGWLTENALAAAGECLVPIETSALSFAGLERLLRFIERLRVEINPELAEPWLLVCRATRDAQSRRIVARLRERYADRVLRTTIRESAQLRSAAGKNKPVTVHFPGGGAAEDFRALAREVVRRGT